MADEKDNKWQCYIIPDLATWTGAAGSKPYTPIEFYDSYEQAAARFQELRSEPYNSEELQGARLTFGVQREDPPSAADLLHVRQGQNYLVDDYTRMVTPGWRPSTKAPRSWTSCGRCGKTWALTGSEPMNRARWSRKMLLSAAGNIPSSRWRENRC